MNDQKELLRPSDLAPLMGVTTSRIHQLVKAGVLPAARIGGAIRIPRAAWDRWLEQQRDEALAAVKQTGEPGRSDDEQAD